MSPTPTHNHHHEQQPQQPLFGGGITLVYGLFVQPPSKEIPYPNLRLPTLDRLGIFENEGSGGGSGRQQRQRRRKFGRPSQDDTDVSSSSSSSSTSASSYVGVAYDANNYASLPSFALSLNVKFMGTLSQTQFDTLQKLYCGWSDTKSRVLYDPQRSDYTLLDFLPPLLQATSGLHFQSSKRTTRRGLPSLIGKPTDRVQRYTDQEVLLTSNCWGFAWEVLYQADNADTSAMTISTADPTSAFRAFRGPGFDLIQTTQTKPNLLTDTPMKRNQKLQAGDVLLIWHQNPSTVSGTTMYLDHVATVLDDDVYYEKSGSGDKVPFRISTWDMITRNFPPSIFFWEWRRLVRNNPMSPNLYSNVPRLQPAKNQFGIDSQVDASDRYVPSTKRNIQDRFSVLADLGKGIQQRLTLQASVEDGGIVESQLYTGILVLEDLVFDETTGRARLPDSAFSKEFYDEKFKRLQKRLNRGR